MSKKKAQIGRTIPPATGDMSSYFNKPFLERIEKEAPKSITTPVASKKKPQTTISATPSLTPYEKEQAAIKKRKLNEKYVALHPEYELDKYGELTQSAYGRFWEQSSVAKTLGKVEGMGQKMLELESIITPAAGLYNLGKKGIKAAMSNLSKRGVDDLGMYTQKGDKQIYELGEGFGDIQKKYSDKLANDEFSEHVSKLSRAERNKLYGLDPGHTANVIDYGPNNPMYGRQDKKNLLMKFIEIDTKQENEKGLQKLIGDAKEYDVNVIKGQAKGGLYGNAKQLIKERQFRHMFAERKGTGTMMDFFKDIPVESKSVENLIEGFNPSNPFSNWSEKRLDYAADILSKKRNASFAFNPNATAGSLPPVKYAEGSPYALAFDAAQSKPRAEALIRNKSWINTGKWEDVGKEMSSTMEKYGLNPKVEADVNKFRVLFSEKENRRVMDEFSQKPTRKILKGISQNENGGKIIPKLKKGQDGLTIPRQEDFPDYESFSSALESFMMGMPGDPTTGIKPERQETLPYTRPQNNPEKLYKTPPITNINQLSPNKPDKKKIDYASLIAMGLAGVDALLPHDQIKDPIVQPQMAYNQHPYGTGSQAYYDHGGKISTTGYKNTSADRGAPSLRIPTGNITMKDVNYPILGVDNTGYSQLMQPEMDYKFPGDYVDEYPIKAQAGKRVPIATNNPNDPRLKAYNDSLKVHNKANAYFNNMRGTNTKTSDPSSPYYLNNIISILTDAEKAQQTGKIKPVGYYGDPKDREKQEAFPYYKKPVQPVVYKKQPDLKSRIKDQAQSTIGQEFNLPGIVQEENRTAPTNLNPTSPYSFTHPTGPYNEQATKYFPDEDSWRNFIGKQNTTSSQSSKKGAAATGNLKEYQPGGSLPKLASSQEEIDIVNKRAREFSTSRNLAPGQNAFAARNIGDPLPQYIDQATGKPYAPTTPTTPLSFTVPKGITELYSEDGRHYYIHPERETREYIDPSVPNQPRFRKTTEVMESDLSMRRASMKDGGVMETIYEEGKEYDIPEEEVARLIAAGYELKLGRKK